MGKSRAPLSIEELQTRLRELGLYTGDIDGRKGKLTIHAIRAFQRLNGLRVDAIVGDKTRKALWPDAIPARDADIPTPPAFPAVWPRQNAVDSFYGPRGGNQVMLQLPYKMKLAWDLRKVVTQFSIHEKVHDSAARAFEKIATAYDPQARSVLGLDLFGGCLASPPRKMRGGNAWSMHSWGIAIDFDPARNQLRWSKKNTGATQPRLSLPDARRFWEIWEAEGWLSLGRARDFDWMHVQAARL